MMDEINIKTLHREIVKLTFKEDPWSNEITRPESKALIERDSSRLPSIRGYPFVMDHGKGLRCGM
jgi:hypothetical protein